MNKITQLRQILYYRYNKLVPSVSGSELVFFVLWPFGALVYALQYFRTSQSKTMFWLFCIFFGYVFVYADPFGLGGSDSARYAAKLIQLHEQPATWEELRASFYNPEEGIVDIYQPLATWLVSLITGDPRILFMLFAAVFGFFYAQNLWLIFTTINKRVGLVLILFMFAYGLVNPLWNINGVRMWTAAQIFLFGNLKYFLFNDKKGWVWSASSILVHFSFLFPVAILAAYIFIPKNIHLFFGFYIFTAFLVEIQLSQVRDFLSFLPDFLQPRVNSYTNETYAERIGEANTQLGWHVIWQGYFATWIKYAWIVALYIRHEWWSRYYPGFFRILMFALFMGGFANIAAQVPSGGRFITVANGLFFALFLGLLGQRKLNLKLWVLEYASLPLLAFVILFRIRMGFDYTGILAFVGNPLVAPFFGSQVPLIDFVKQIF